MKLARLGPDGRFKLRHLPGLNLRFDGGYRGNQSISWDLETTKKGPGMEVFATWCSKCLASWGWTPDLAQINQVQKAMAKHGCPRCPKASTQNRKDQAGQKKS